MRPSSPSASSRRRQVHTELPVECRLSGRRSRDDGHHHRPRPHTNSQEAASDRQVLASGRVLGSADRRKPRDRHAVAVDVPQRPRSHQQPTLEQARQEGKCCSMPSCSPARRAGSQRRPGVCCNTCHCAGSGELPSSLTHPPSPVARPYDRERPPCLLVRQPRSWSMRAYRSHDPSGQGPLPLGGAAAKRAPLRLAGPGKPSWSREHGQTSVPLHAIEGSPPRHPPLPPREQTALCSSRRGRTIGSLGERLSSYGIGLRRA